MQKSCSVIFEDQVIVIDGEAIRTSFVQPPNYHAVQWDEVNQKGHLEYKSGREPEPINAEFVQDYVDIFNATKASRQQQEEQASKTPAALHALVNYERARRQDAGFTFSGQTIDSDMASQQKIMAEVLASQIGVRTDGEVWRSKNNIDMPLTNNEVIQMATALRNHIKALFTKASELKRGIEQGTITERAQITGANWPA